MTPITSPHGRYAESVAASNMSASMRGLLALAVVAFVLFAGAGVTIEVLALSPDTLDAIADR